MLSTRIEMEGYDMTWNEILKSDLLFLRASHICGSVLPVAEKTFRKQAKQRPETLGFPVCVIGEKVFIPRKPLIAFIENYHLRMVTDEPKIGRKDTL